MRPVQLIPSDKARKGAIARDVPPVDPVACRGCPLIPVCQGRGDATVFAVREVRGQPQYCQQIDGHMVACRADHMPELEPAEPVRTEPAIAYLADSNVFINARRWNWKQCQLVLEHAGGHYTLATTDLVRDELHHSYSLPVHLEVLPTDVDAMHPELLEIAEANRAEDDPTDKASMADLSLVQALLDHPKYVGLISEDDDLQRIHVPSLVRQLAGRDVEFLTSADLCRKHPRWFPDYEA